MSEILKEILSNPSKTVLTIHRKPDGDSIGSNLALFKKLKENNHEVTIFSKDKIPEKFSYLADLPEIQIKSPNEIPWENFDRYIALDMANAEMLGEKVEFPNTLEITTIDHHYTNKGWGKENIVDPNSISASSVLFSQLEKLNISIDPQTATSLLTGISTDSGFFTFSENEDPFEQSAKLIKKGGDYRKIVDSLLNTIPLGDIPFISKSLAKLEIDKIKKVAFILINHKLWNNFGVSSDKNIYLLHYINKIEETDLGALLIEEKLGEIRVELRSRKNDFDVSKLAEAIGGGGHRKSSGSRLYNMSLKRAKEKILENI